MKQPVLLYIILILLNTAGCRSKKEPGDNAKDGKESFFPVLSFIQSQVADIDSSLYPIRKIIYIDSLHSDTTWVKREEFRDLAKDFLEIPDLAAKKFKDLYTEEKLFDESLNRVILSYKPTQPDQQDIQSQEVLITPDIASGDKVRSIIINRSVITKDSAVQRRLLWQVDQSFQVTTIVQKPGLPETIRTMKVTWNEKEPE